jgi:hypothetical protein
MQGHGAEHRHGIEVLHPIGIADDRQAGDQQGRRGGRVRQPADGAVQGGDAQQHQAGGGGGRGAPRARGRIAEQALGEHWIEQVAAEHRVHRQHSGADDKGRPGQAPGGRSAVETFGDSGGRQADHSDGGHGRHALQAGQHLDDSGDMQAVADQHRNSQQQHHPGQGADDHGHDRQGVTYSTQGPITRRG